jgi:hypothetical protein
MLRNVKKGERMSRPQIHIVRERIQLTRELLDLLVQEQRLATQQIFKTPQRTQQSSQVSSIPARRRVPIMVTGLMKAIRDAMPPKPETFNVRTLIKAMLAGGYKFKTADPRVSVSSALRKLQKYRQEIVTVRTGKSGQPSTYRRA